MPNAAQQETTDNRKHAWEDVIDDEIRAIADNYSARRGLKDRPALICVDNFNAVFGDRREPPLESMKRFRSSCGLAAWEAIEPTRRLMAAAREAGLPVVHTTAIADLPPMLFRTAPRMKPPGGQTNTMASSSRVARATPGPTAVLKDQVFYEKCLQVTQDPARTSWESMRRVAADLGMSQDTLRGWVKQDRIDRGDGKPGELSTAERRELVTVPLGKQRPPDETLRTVLNDLTRSRSMPTWGSTSAVANLAVSVSGNENIRSVAEVRGAGSPGRNAPAGRRWRSR